MGSSVLQKSDHALQQTLVNAPSEYDRVQDKLAELGLEMYPSYYWQAIEYFVNNPEYAKRWLRSAYVIKRQVLTEKIGPWPGYGWQYCVVYYARLMPCLVVISFIYYLRIVLSFYILKTLCYLYIMIYVSLSNVQRSVPKLFSYEYDLCFINQLLIASNVNSGKSTNR